MKISLAFCGQQSTQTKQLEINDTKRPTEKQKEAERKTTSNAILPDEWNVQYVKLPHKLVMIWKLKLFIASFLEQVAASQKRSSR